MILHYRRISVWELIVVELTGRDHITLVICCPRGSATTVLSAGFLDTDLAIFFAHQLFKLSLLATLFLRGLFVKASLLDFLEKSLFGDGSLEALKQLFGSFSATECHSNQCSPLSLESTYQINVSTLGLICRSPGPNRPGDSTGVECRFRKINGKEEL